MPLFQFNYAGKEFKFSNTYALKNFDHKQDIPKNINGLSPLDVSHLSRENWALIGSDPNLENYKAEINLLLLSFKIYSFSNCFIKWRFCQEDPTLSTCLNDRFRDLVLNNREEITEEDLNKVKEGFTRILKMYDISDRTKNALYFVWRGLSSDKHIDSYIFLVCALEALFSSENTEGVTKIIVERTKNFVKGVKGLGGDQIKKIYGIRSDMVHGRIRHTDKKDVNQRKKNIDNLGKLEFLIFTCMRKFLDENIYLKYKNIDEKEKFFNELIKNRITTRCT